MENPIKMDDLGVPPFKETPIFLIPFQYWSNMEYVWSCWQNHQRYQLGNLTHTIHVRYIYLHLVDFYGINVGNYTIHECFKLILQMNLDVFLGWFVWFVLSRAALPSEKKRPIFFAGEYEIQLKPQPSITGFGFTAIFASVGFFLEATRLTRDVRLEVRIKGYPPVNKHSWLENPHLE